MLPNYTEYLGVDFGLVKVGIARGSEAARIAEPIRTVTSTEAIAALSELANQNKAAGIVIGLPRSLNGHETDQTRLVRQWAAQAQEQIGVPCYWQDEALTSQKADRQTSKVDEHSRAAAIILQDFLDTPAKNRIRI